MQTFIQTVMDEDDFDEFTINKINHSVIIIWTVMTFHLLLLKQDITLLFSHLKQVLSSWTDE